MRRPLQIRSPISAPSLKGYLLEEILAYLISRAGYRLLTRVQDDPHDLDYFGNGLQVRGRGGYHQADVLGEWAWTPAFSNPIRLFLEAKWRGAHGGSKVGIPEVRQAVGVTQDINQILSTVRRTPGAGSPPPHEEDGFELQGRGFCYSYRYALFSTSGFSKHAQTYALAHQVTLIDLSGPEFGHLLSVVDDVGEGLRKLYLDDRGEQDGEYPAGAGPQRAEPRPRFVRQLRARVRREFWDDIWDDLNELMTEISA
jgi:hypothetical protein